MASDYIKRHKSWQEYAKKELALGRKPKKFKDWMPELKSKSNTMKEYAKRTGTPKFEGAGGSDLKELQKRFGKSKYQRSKK